MSKEIIEAFREDTVGRSYRAPTMSKKGVTMHNSEQNGETSAINIKLPMTKETFNRLPDTLKAVYIKSLRAQYGVTASQIAKMLEYSSSAFSGILSKLQLHGVFRQGNRMTKRQTAEWQKFLNVTNNAQKPRLINETQPLTMCCSCAFTMRGELQTEDIVSRIHTMISEGTKCLVSVKIDTIDE